MGWTRIRNNYLHNVLTDTNFILSQSFFHVILLLFFSFLGGKGGGPAIGNMQAPLFFFSFLVSHKANYINIKPQTPASVLSVHDAEALQNYHLAPKNIHEHHSYIIWEPLQMGVVRLQKVCAYELIHYSYGVTVLLQGLSVTAIWKHLYGSLCYVLLLVCYCCYVALVLIVDYFRFRRERGKKRSTYRSRRWMEQVNQTCSWSWLDWNHHTEVRLFHAWRGGGGGTELITPFRNYHIS